MVCGWLLYGFHMVCMWLSWFSYGLHVAFAFAWFSYVLHIALYGLHVAASVCFLHEVGFNELDTLMNWTLPYTYIIYIYNIVRLRHIIFIGSVHGHIIFMCSACAADLFLLHIGLHHIWCLGRHLRVWRNMKGGGEACTLRIDDRHVS